MAPLSIVLDLKVEGTFKTAIELTTVLRLIYSAHLRLLNLDQENLGPIYIVLMLQLAVAQSS